LSIGKTLKKEKGKKIKEEILTGFSRNPQNDKLKEMTKGGDSSG
jgi:hypothetical protein